MTAIGFLNGFFSENRDVSFSESLSVSKWFQYFAVSEAF